MFKLLFLFAILFLFTFSLRVMQIGGIDPTYRDSSSTLLLSFRNYLVNVFDQILPYPQSALLSGIVLGSQERLSFTLKTQLQITSTIHIIVVSGQNLTILAGFVKNLGYFLGRKKMIILTFLTVVFYSILTGLQVPVLRAAIMVTLTYLAQFLGKEKTGWWVLAITASLMLIYNPHWLLNISFQLSFLATLGVVVVAPIFIKLLKFIPGFFKEDLSVTLAAQILVLPIIVYNFYQLSLIGILINSLILWTIPIVMISGFVALILGLINNLLGQLVGLLPSVLLTYFIYLVQFFSKIPGAYFKIGQTAPLVWTGYYLSVGAGIWILARKQKSLK